MTKYQVIVGNIGTVYDGPDRATADQLMAEYIRQSKTNRGRAGREPVTLFQDDDILQEYQPGPSFRLGDDGTLDTVIVCTDCGAEMRFNADETIHPDNCVNTGGTCGCYDAFVEQCIADCESDHECEVVAQ